MTAATHAPVGERLLRRADTSGECWIWQGYTDRNGYGMIAVAGKARLVHRVAHELWIGPIPDGLQVDHLCYVRSCFNPAHLEAVTLEVNAARTRPGIRGQERARFQKSKTHCPRNHPYDSGNTYVSKDGYRWCRACRRERYAERKDAS